MAVTKSFDGQGMEDAREKRTQQVHTEQIRVLYSNAKVSVGATVCVASILGYFQWEVISHPIVLGWLIYMLVISSARYVLARRYWRTGGAFTKASAWGATFTIGTGLAAAGWGSAGILLYPEASLPHQVFLVFVLGGIMLGAAPILAPRPEAFFTFQISTGIPITVRFLLQGDNLHLAMGLLAIIHTTATLITTWRIYLTVVSSLNFRFENQELVGDLQIAREQAERALRDSERSLTLAQSTARLGVWSCDLRTNVTAISGEYAGLHGLAPDHPPLTHEEWLGLVHPDDRELVQTRWRESVERRHPWDIEYRVVWPDGSVHWLLAKGKVYLDGSGRPVHMAGVSLDITERKQAEAALLESEERFRNMADTAPVMIWVAGPDKVLTFFNKTWLDFVGRSLEQELNNGWVESVHPEDLGRCFASYSASFDARQNFHIEYRLRRADGEYRRVLCSGVPRFAPGGIFAGYIGSDMDITDLRRTQEEAFERQKLESLGVLTGGIAHDFNNLLGSILLDAELAEANLAAGSPAGEEIEQIKAVAIRAAEIVRELMIYSGQDKADLGPVDLSRLVEEMLELLRVSISKHAVLKTDLRKYLRAVQGNATQLRQIVMNLIINASEAIGDKDGVIEVTTSLAAGGANLPEGDYLQLDVSDTGCGITEEQKARIFEPFFTTKFAGRGLGLAVVQGIVRAHGGMINLISAPGQGTRFQILLPCADKPVEPERAISVLPAGEPISGASGTVLLVEDEEALRRSVSNMLRKRGFSVVEAGDGSAAVDLFRNYQDRIDVILLDMTIPGSSSREVVEEARRLRPDIKVILTSAYSREMVMPSLDGPPIRAFIRKPFPLADLVELLRNTLAS